jgi:AcrR family transcriptional regulator
MPRNAPVQARSIASTEAMLIAGEVLFREGGASAVTLEAVIQRAGVSTGSFYARFGSMNGYFDAMHKHVLEMLRTEFGALYFKATNENDLESCLETLLTGAFKVARDNKDASYFFAVENSHNSMWLSEGLKFEAELDKANTQIISKHVSGASTKEGKLKIEIAVRSLNALVFDQIVKQASNLGGKNISEKTFVREQVAMLSAYLRATPKK